VEAYWFYTNTLKDKKCKNSKLNVKMTIWKCNGRPVNKPVYSEQTSHQHTIISTFHFEFLHSSYVRKKLWSVIQFHIYHTKRNFTSLHRYPWLYKLYRPGMSYSHPRACLEEAGCRCLPRNPDRHYLPWYHCFWEPSGYCCYYRNQKPASRLQTTKR
jgi:hypothetical protein